MQKEWFVNWFDSKYYHILYKSRNDGEAAFFADNLSVYLKLKDSDLIWDLACGTGRHAYYLSKKNINVTGTDLSENCIKTASKLSNENLEFFIHDMRTPFRINYFDYVFNLFTSIGYFEKRDDNRKVFKNVFNSLKPDGRLVIDFFNEKLLRKNIVGSEKIEIGNIHFQINRQIENNAVIKKIEFSDLGNNYSFEERVCMFSLNDFIEFALASGLKIENTFGDYSLSAFDENKSERLIIVFRK